MMITISLNQEVESNKNYVTCESGIFQTLDFVLCKNKLEEQNNTVMFLVDSIITTGAMYESSNGTDI